MKKTGNYDRKQQFYDLFDFNAKGNPFILNKIPEKVKVLDVGCGSGNLGVGLKEKSCTSYGIDISTASIKKSRSKMDKVFKVDLDNSTQWPFEDKFDYVVLADILEHLKNPQLVLELAKKHTKPEGKIIVSIPNVAFITLRINLLLGKFNYTDWGICDDTHLRFYTLETITKLLNDHNLKIESIEGFPLTIRKLTQITYPLTQLFKTLLARQFIIVAQKS